MLADKLTIFYFEYFLINFWAVKRILFFQKTYKWSHFKFQNREIQLLFYFFLISIILSLRQAFLVYLFEINFFMTLFLPLIPNFFRFLCQNHVKN